MPERISVDSKFMNSVQIILASGSPRRRELLEKAGLRFRIVVSAADEHYTKKDPAGIVEELSRIKAEVVERELFGDGSFSAEAPEDETVIIGADTVVSVDGRILGKPKDRADAFRMIRRIQGRSHEVYTGVCLIRTGKERASRLLNFSECTKVHVVPMSEAEIHAYIDCGESMDKAGAYAIQGQFGKYIDRFDGDYENVIGLPVQAVLDGLEEIMKEDGTVCPDAKA